MALHDLAKMTTATVGTGTLTLASAVAGYLTFALAGVVDGEVVSYGIFDTGTANSETGHGVYTSSGTTLTRNVVASSNSGSAISLSGTAIVVLTLLAEDLSPYISSATSVIAGLSYNVNTVAGGFTVTLPGNPATGATIEFSDNGNSWAKNNLIVNPNGKTINGLSGNFTVDVSGAKIEISWDGTTWNVV